MKKTSPDPQLERNPRDEDLESERLRCKTQHCPSRKHSEAPSLPAVSSLPVGGWREAGPGEASTKLAWRVNQEARHHLPSPQLRISPSPPTLVQILWCQTSECLEWPPGQVPLQSWPSASHPPHHGCCGRTALVGKGLRRRSGLGSKASAATCILTIISCLPPTPHQLAQKYDLQREQELREWIEGVTGRHIGNNFMDGLKDGIILCE